jgi:hypothetical protein
MILFGICSLHYVFIFFLTSSVVVGRLGMVSLLTTPWLKATSHCGQGQVSMSRTSSSSSLPSASLSLVDIFAAVFVVVVVVWSRGKNLVVVVVWSRGKTSSSSSSPSASLSLVDIFAAVLVVVVVVKVKGHCQRRSRHRRRRLGWRPRRRAVVVGAKHTYPKSSSVVVVVVGGSSSGQVHKEPRHVASGTKVKELGRLEDLWWKEEGCEGEGAIEIIRKELERSFEGGQRRPEGGEGQVSSKGTVGASQSSQKESKGGVIITAPGLRRGS